MFNRRSLILLSLSLVMGAGAAYTANRWASQQIVGEEENANTLVVAASMSIPYGTKVEGRHLKMVEIPPDATPAGFFTSFEEIEGQVSRAPISRGEILIQERFAAHEAGSTLAALVSENMRALTVRVNDVIGVAGFLLPGNRVDVLSSRKPAGGNTRAVTETILKNIKVLAVDQTATTEKNEPVIVRAVTLEMTPAQAEVLVKARTEGEIQLTLRNPLEEELEPVIEPEPAAKPPVVAKKPAPRRVNRSSTIEVIRGTKVDKTKTKS